MVLAGIGGLGAPELLLILVIVLVLFGGSRLATLGKEIGQGIREFRKATQEEKPESQPAAPPGERPPAAGASPPTTALSRPPEYRPSDAAPPAPTQHTPERPPDVRGA
ncbi:MAG: twin-arginine translocase TatA/TatE family subunit [Chloroflexota bacterium]